MFSRPAHFTTLALNPLGILIYTLARHVQPEGPVKALFVLLLLSIVAVVPAIGSDQDNAIKQIRMITALSRDDTARSLVNRAFADVFKVERSRLVLQRKTLGLTYGNLFLAHELTVSGEGMEQIATMLHENKTIVDIANAFNADWKRIAADAKRMNNHINNAIYKYFLHPQLEIQQDAKDHYFAPADLIKADADSTPDEILSAQKDFVFWHNLAASKSGQGVQEFNPAVQDYQQGREDAEASRVQGSSGPTR
jgi:hypothetical protein